MISTYKAAPDIDVLTTSFPIPGFGQLAINSFVLQGDVPILVDTGPVVERGGFMTALKSVIDPGDLRWIWLTHTDGDHIGALGQLLADYPEIKVITTFLGVGIMSVSDPLPLDRVQLVNPGQSITIGSRTLTAIRPPTFDNPSTTGFFDEGSRVLFPADSFGALLREVPENAGELAAGDLRDGQILWATIDSPWLHEVDPTKLEHALHGIGNLEPSLVLSSHLPAASGELLGRLLDSIAAVPEATPFVGPDQAALAQLLAQMALGPRERKCQRRPRVERLVAPMGYNAFFDL